MQPDPLARVVALLERTPGALDALLRGLPVELTDSNEGGDSWSPREVVAHLSHAERTNWMPRVRHLLKFGESEAFPSFDRLGQRQRMDAPIGELLAEFAALRATSLDALRALTLGPEQLERRGLHPRLGPTTLSELLAAWASHDLTHMHQITRVLAYQYREAVGPWSKFLGVMHCAGHGA